MSQIAFFVLALARFPAFASFALFFSLLAYTEGERGRLQNQRRIRTLELVIEHLFVEVDDIITLVGRLGAAAESDQRPEANDRDQPMPLPSTRHDIRQSYEDVQHCVRSNPSANLRFRGANRQRIPADTHNFNYARALARLDGLPTTTPGSSRSPIRNTLPRNSESYPRRPPTPLANGSIPLTNSASTRIRPRERIANGYLLASSSNNVRPRESNNTLTSPLPTNNHTPQPFQPSALSAAQRFHLTDDLGKSYTHELHGHRN
jgi:hypothetical protein